MQVPVDWQGLRVVVPAIYVTVPLCVTVTQIVINMVIAVKTLRELACHKMKVKFAIIIINPGNHI